MKVWSEGSPGLGCAFEAQEQTLSSSLQMWRLAQSHGVGEQGFTASHGDTISQTWPLTILPLKCWSQILVRSHLPSPSPPPDCMRALLMKENRLG